MQDAFGFVVKAVGDDDLGVLLHRLNQLRPRFQMAKFTPPLPVLDQTLSVVREVFGFVLFEPGKGTTFAADLRKVLTHPKSRVEHAVERYGVTGMNAWRNKILICIEANSFGASWFSHGDCLNFRDYTPIVQCKHTHLLDDHSYCLRCGVITKFDLFFSQEAAAMYALNSNRQFCVYCCSFVCWKYNCHYYRPSKSICVESVVSK